MRSATQRIKYSKVAANSIKQLVQPCFIPEYTSRNGRPHDIDGALAKLHGIAVIAPHQMAQRKRLLSPSQRGLDHPPDVTNFTCFGLHDN